MHTSEVPNLLTFNNRASWLNRAGRIDRSACVELKASDLWRSIPEHDWQKRARHDRAITKGARPFLIAEARADITAYQLADLHDTQNPFTLKGDHRTPKSNALKHTIQQPTQCPKAPQSSQPVVHQPPSQSPRIASVGSPSPLKPPASSLPHSGAANSGGNPNKGQSRTKMLGLPTNWSQPLTIQRWRLHHSLAQHFFTCPGCKQRALKLFLPLCTEQELHDANLARLWLDSNKQCIARSVTLRPRASHLLARYAPLFPPRQLQCRKCLGLRYGEVRTKG
jgi:hypothetical protein